MLKSGHKLIEKVEKLNNGKRIAGRSYKEPGFSGKLTKRYGKKTGLKHESLYEEFCLEFLFACNMGMLKLKWFKCCQGR